MQVLVVVQQGLVLDLLFTLKISFIYSPEKTFFLSLVLPVPYSSACLPASSTSFSLSHPKAGGRILLNKFNFLIGVALSTENTVFSAVRFL